MCLWQKVQKRFHRPRFIRCVNRKPTLSVAFRSAISSFAGKKGAEGNTAISSVWCLSEEFVTSQGFFDTESTIRFSTSSPVLQPAVWQCFSPETAAAHGFTSELSDIRRQRRRVCRTNCLQMIQVPVDLLTDAGIVMGSIRKRGLQTFPKGTRLDRSHFGEPLLCVCLSTASSQLRIKVRRWWSGSHGAGDH